MIRLVLYLNICELKFAISLTLMDSGSSNILKRRLTKSGSANKSTPVLIITIATSSLIKQFAFGAEDLFSGSK